MNDHLLPDPLVETTPMVCSLEGEQVDPVGMVIFGASGDLTSRKLIPAIFDLYLEGHLCKPFFVLGVGRTRLDDRAFRKRVAEGVEAAARGEQARWETFAGSLHYLAGEYDSPADHRRLAARVEELEQRHGTGGNRIFYLAVPPSLYGTIAQQLGGTGLAREDGANGRWARLVVEKPFGRDLETARELETTLHASFQEHQLYRIDHYLAKETVQNILVFRLANSIFEPIWNRNYIEHVSITAAETLGVEHRAGYYDRAGVLRDMFQNHMMQLLSLTAMEPPSHFEADQVRDEKAKLFDAVRPFPPELTPRLVVGQYGSGTVDGQEVPAYLDEPGVSPTSTTPTFARMELFIDNWRWQGVPFYLTSGKRLSKKLTEIVIQFKEVPHSVFRDLLEVASPPNRLTLGIQPEEAIRLTFQTKLPGPRVRLRPVTMRFDYDESSFGQSRLDAYAKVLLDAMLGDQMLFWRQDGLERSWGLLTPILDRCETCAAPGPIDLETYPAGSNGPGPQELAAGTLRG